jgi:hypothetical protein
MDLDEIGQPAELALGTSLLLVYPIAPISAIVFPPV